MNLCIDYFISFHKRLFLARHACNLNLFVLCAYVHHYKEPEQKVLVILQ